MSLYISRIFKNVFHVLCIHCVERTQDDLK